MIIHNTNTMIVHSLNTLAISTLWITEDLLTGAASISRLSRVELGIADTVVLSSTSTIVVVVNSSVCIRSNPPSTATSTPIGSGDRVIDGDHNSRARSVATHTIGQR